MPRRTQPDFPTASDMKLLSAQEMLNDDDQATMLRSETQWPRWAEQ